MSVKLFVGNLPSSVTEEQLNELFSGAGVVEETAIVMNKVTGEPRGFGFVTMADEAEANAAIEQFNGYDLDGNALTVNVARPKTEGGAAASSENKLYVGNIPYSMDRDSLNTMFQEAGSVTDAVVIMDRESGRSKGFGFVTMATSEEAEAAIEKFNGFEVDGRELVVNRARPQEPRRNFGGGGRYERGGSGRYERPGRYEREDDYSRAA